MNEITIRVCCQCGNRFEFFSRRDRPHEGRYCSRKCSNLSRSLSPESLLRKYVIPGHPDECWEWKGFVNPDGYGQTNIRLPDGRRRCLKGHQLAALVYGIETDEGEEILHLCDNRLCTNPAHLRAGTHFENVMDMINRGRHAFDQGRVPLTEEIVIAIRRERNEGATLKQLGIKYNRDLSTISAIARGKTWKHIGG